MSKAHVRFLVRSQTEVTFTVAKNGRGVGEVSARSALAKRFLTVSPERFVISIVKGHNRFKHGATRATIQIEHLPSDELEKIPCYVPGPVLS